MLGLTFKPNTADLREEPSLVNIPMIVDEGDFVKVYDLVGNKNFKKIMSPELNNYIRWKKLY